MKKIIKLVSMLTLLTILVCCFVGCAPKANMTVVVTTDPNTVYTVDLNKLKEGCNAMDVLEYLKEKQGLTYVAQDSDYGPFLTEVLTLKQSEDFNPYISIYTSVQAEQMTDYDGVEYEGVMLYPSSVGIGSMTVEEGCIIYITLISY
ncbi:MAG: hypothetical protein ACI4M0_06690 [Christensenellales bacterium]